MTYPHPQNEPDPFDSADSATIEPRTYYGQVDVDAWFCALVKGQGKVPYDSAVHERRSTAVKLTVAPIPDMKLTFALEREMIAESREWAAIVLPSIKALGLASVRDLDGKWVAMTQVPTGRKYRNRNGEEKDATTFKFLSLYDSEAACIAAFNGARNGTPPADALPEDEMPFMGDGNGHNGQPAPDSPERQTALAFLKVLVQQHGADTAALGAAIASMPMIAKHFTIDSPETQALLAGN